jgi:hypothetical protein
MVLFPQVVLSANLAFDQYRVEKIFQGKPAVPDLKSHPDARTYRTVLSEQSKKGPNFAGHYTLVTFGCGASCVRIAVVDAENGHVLFPRNLHMMIVAAWSHDPSGCQFKQNSRLLIVYGQVNSEEGPDGISYFEWKGKNFELLRFEPHGAERHSK